MKVEIRSFAWAASAALCWPNRRDAQQKSIRWVMPHSVRTLARMTAVGATDRIVLDTNIVRGLIEGEPECLNVPRLQRLKGAHPVSIADGAFGELFWWFRKAHETRPDLLQKVKPALERLDPLLDREFPITPGGSQRLAMIGLISWPARSRAGDSNLYNAYWRHLKRVKDRHSLTIICTEDMRFIKAVRRLQHEDRFRVMNLAQLYAWLETGTLA